jgi:RNA polymerase sigma-70 factor (ECF subfamily)
LRDDATIGYGLAFSHQRGRHAALAGSISSIMADLLRRVAEQADTAAFRELYQLYGPRVKAYMMRQGADAGTAEDLAQETLFTVWRRASLYTADKGSAATWIFTIARNLRIDRLRREVPWQELPKERQVLVRTVLASLPPDQQSVVALSYLEGLSHGEIAERLKLPLGTVKSRMRIAYQKIRAGLEDLK